MRTDIVNSLTIWLLFWLVLGLASYIGYVIVAKKQNRKVSLKYTIMLLFSVALAAAVLLYF